MDVRNATWSNPIWHGKWRIFYSHSHFHDVAYCHDDYGGAEDANDNRHGWAATVEEAKAEIDEREDA